MTRTWQQNSDAINGLWPQCQWTDEEIELWRSDLSALDQDVLFEAIREVKRSRDSLYPQLVWVHTAYRTLFAAKRAAERPARDMTPAFCGERLEIDVQESGRLAAEIAAEIEHATPADVDAILRKIHECTDRMDAATGCRLAWRAAARRNHPGESRPTSSGAVRPSPRTMRAVGHDDDLESRRAEQLRLLRNVHEPIG
jgi:hypothetical protein